MMFCSKCGTQIPGGSVFCHKCGNRLLRVDAEQSPSTVESPDDVQSVGAASGMTAPPPPSYAWNPAAHRSVSTGQVIVGVVVLLGAVLTIMGCLMPWFDSGYVTYNAFDMGSLTDPKNGVGKDGIVLLLAALAVGALAIPYFVARSSSAKIFGSVGVLLLGVGITAVGGFDLGRLIKESIDYCDCMDYIGSGLYITVAGGIIVTVAAVAGMINAAIQQNRA